MKNKCIMFLFIIINLTNISCQSKSDKIDLNIMQETYENIIKDHQTYFLRYNNYVDSTYHRVVIREEEIHKKWQPFNDAKLKYMDVYFNKKNEAIGFKGFIKENSKNNAEDLYKLISRRISNNNDFWPIKLNVNDTHILIDEWESKEMVIGVEYEIGSKQFAMTAVKKDELTSFYDQIFDIEFLNLTKFRAAKSKIKFKRLNSKSSKSDKEFYKEKFKELKDDYNKKYNGK